MGLSIFVGRRSPPGWLILRRGNPLQAQLSRSRLTSRDPGCIRQTSCWFTALRRTPTRTAGSRFPRGVRSRSLGIGCMHKKARQLRSERRDIYPGTSERGALTIIRARRHIRSAPSVPCQNGRIETSFWPKLIRFNALLGTMSSIVESIHTLLSQDYPRNDRRAASGVRKTASRRIARFLGDGLAVRVNVRTGARYP